MPGELLGLAWPLLPGERHPVPHHQDLQRGTAITDIRWHVGNRRAEQLHPAVSDKSPLAPLPHPSVTIPVFLQEFLLYYFLVGIPRLSVWLRLLSLRCNQPQHLPGPSQMIIFVSDEVSHLAHWVGALLD